MSYLRLIAILWRVPSLIFQIGWPCSGCWSRFFYFEAIWSVVARTLFSRCGFNCGEECLVVRSRRSSSSISSCVRKSNRLCDNRDGHGIIIRLEQSLYFLMGPLEKIVCPNVGIEQYNTKLVFIDNIMSPF